MAKKATTTPAWHLSLSLGKDLWDQLLSTALPVRLAGGTFDVVRDMRDVVLKLDVEQRVRGLLEERKPPELVLKVKDRAMALWQERRVQVRDVVHELVQVDGDWLVEIAREGSEFRYARQKVGLKAHIMARAEGEARLAWENLVLPFTLEKGALASVDLREIHYDKDKEAVMGHLGGIRVDLGEHVLLQLIGQVAEYALEQQIPNLNPIQILSKEQVESLVAPAGGPLRLQMGVEDLQLEVTEEDVTLRVRFGFTRPQIEERKEPVRRRR